MGSLTPQLSKNWTISPNVRNPYVSLLGMAGWYAFQNKRAYDGTLGRIVYWDSVSIDRLGSAYEGPGPLSDVVIFMFQGAGL